MSQRAVHEMPQLRKKEDGGGEGGKLNNSLYAKTGSTRLFLCHCIHPIIRPNLVAPVLYN